MSLSVLLYANYREIAGTRELLLPSSLSTAGAVVDELISRFPDLIPLMMQDGGLKWYVNILVDGVSIRETGGLTTPVRDGSEIKIFPPVSGG